MSNGKTNPLVEMRTFLGARKQEIAQTLPPDISYEQILRAFTTSASINPEILTCSKQSLWLAILRACRDGLLPDGKEGAIVAFKDKANWIPMYTGLLRRFRRSGKFKSVSAHVVYEGEEFSYFIDENGPHLKHVPGDTFETAPIVKVYARAATNDGGIFIEVMNKAEIDKHRKMSRTTRDDAPWKLWFEEMAKKTVIIRLSKFLPDARDIIGDEDALDDDSGPTTVGAGNSGSMIGAPAAGTPSPQPASGGEQTYTESPKEAAEVSNSATAEQSAAAVETSEGRILFAHGLGKGAKEGGQRRADIPHEYRDGKHDQEAAAWYAGYDGKELSTREA